MNSRDSQKHRTYVERVIETVASWPGITTGEGRFSSTSFGIAAGEIGHVHPSGAVDVTYPPPLRDQLIAEGRTGEHHVVPNSSTATTFYVESEADVDDAVWLLRLAYLSRVNGLKERGETIPELTDVDLDEELDDLAPGDALREIFEATESS